MIRWMPTYLSLLPPQDVGRHHLLSPRDTLSGKQILLSFGRYFEDSSQVLPSIAEVLWQDEAEQGLQKCTVLTSISGCRNEWQ